MANKGFLWKMAGVVLAGGLVLMSCGEEEKKSSSPSLTTITDSSISGSTWVAEFEEDMSDIGGGKIKIKSTLKFTSGTAGTIKNEVTNWGSITGEMKTKFQEMIEEDNGNITYTYTSGAGSIITKSSDTINFTVNVTNNKLITTDEDGTTEFKQTA
jgi:hypothetical protein